MQLLLLLALILGDLNAAAVAACWGRLWVAPLGVSSALTTLGPPFRVRATRGRLILGPEF